MIAIKTRARHIIVAPAHQHDGVASMLVALGDAGIGVSQVESQVDYVGTYRLTVDDRPEVAVRILEGIGCLVTVRENSLIGSYS